MPQKGGKKTGTADTSEDQCYAIAAKMYLFEYDRSVTPERYFALPLDRRSAVWLKLPGTTLQTKLIANYALLLKTTHHGKWTETPAQAWHRNPLHHLYITPEMTITFVRFNAQLINFCSYKEKVINCACGISPFHSPTDKKPTVWSITDEQLRIMLESLRSFVEFWNPDSLRNADEEINRLLEVLKTDKEVLFGE